MSVVIIGGHERMESKYKEICRRYHCKVKVFTKMKTDLNHKMRCALAESEHSNAVLERSHSSSASALINILEAYA